MLQEPNGDDKPITAVIKDGSVSPTDPSKDSGEASPPAKDGVSDPPKDPVEEKLSSGDLLNQFQAKLNPKPDISDEQRNKDRENNRVEFELQLRTAVNKINEVSKEEGDVEAALALLPDHLRGKVTKIVNGEQLNEIKEEIDSNVKLNQVLDEREFTSVYPKVLEQAGLNVNTSRAIAEKNRLDSLIIEITKGPSNKRALEIATNAMSLLDAGKQKEAFKKGVEVGNLTRLPDGEIPKTKPKGNQLTGDLAEVAKRLGISQEDMDKHSK